MSENNVDTLTRQLDADCPPPKGSDKYAPVADEPFFTLLGRDVAAPSFVRAYGYYLQGNISMAEHELALTAQAVLKQEPLAAHHPKVRSCFTAADEMEAFGRRKALGS